MKINLMKKLGITAASVLALGIASCDMFDEKARDTKNKMPQSFEGVMLFAVEDDELYIKSIYRAGRVIKDGKNFDGKETLIYHLKCNGHIEKNPYAIRMVYSNHLEEVHYDRNGNGFVDSPGMITREMSPENNPKKNPPKCK